MKTFYNLPKKIIFCKKCVNSNQYPTSIPEFKHTKNRKNASYINFNSDGICDGCIQAEVKKKSITSAIVLCNIPLMWCKLYY